MGGDRLLWEVFSRTGAPGRRSPGTRSGGRHSEGVRSASRTDSHAVALDLSIQVVGPGEPMGGVGVAKRDNRVYAEGRRRFMGRGRVWGEGV